jgi:hypothetical protein
MNQTNKKIVFIMRITTSTRTRKRGEILTSLFWKNVRETQFSALLTRAPKRMQNPILTIVETETNEGK